MHLTRRRFVACSAAAAATAATIGAPTLARARIGEVARIYVPFAVGGTIDFIARQMSEQLRGSVADTLVVENKSGAAGRLTIDALRLAPADGLTLAVHAGGIQSLYPHIFKQLSYDPFADVAPVSMTNRLEFGYAVGPAVPDSVKNLKDYGDWIKADDKRAAYATPGAGTPLHFLPLLLGRGIGVEMNPVHYRGTAAAFPDLMGGQVPALSSPLHDLVQQVPSGKVRILASSGAVRNKLTPNVATYAEQGFPQLTSGDWYAIYVSGKTPPALQEQLSQAVRKALANPQLVANFAKAYIEPAPCSPADAVRAARADNALWGATVKAVGYVPE